MEILERNCAHKWLGCMISTDDGRHGLDPEHHFQAAAKKFYANKPLVEKCHGMGDGTGKNWKTKEHMGLPNTHALPMETRRKVEEMGDDSKTDGGGGG